MFAVFLPLSWRAPAQMQTQEGIATSGSEFGCCAQAPRAEETAALRGQLADLQRDNGILKRAVAIQNARLQVCISRWGFSATRHLFNPQL